MIRIRHQLKIWMVIGVWTSGIFFLFVAKYTSIFSLVLISCMFIGVGSTMGTLVVLGFMKCFPASVFSGYSTGTGVSGILASVLYMYMKFDQFSFDSILLVMMMFYPFYGLGFYFVINIRKRLQEKMQLSQILKEVDIESIDSQTLSDLSTANLHSDVPRTLKSDFSTLAENFPDSDSESPENVIVSKTDPSSRSDVGVVYPGDQILSSPETDFEVQEANMNETISIENLKHVHKILYLELALFFFMYFFEYFSITELAEKSSQHFEHLLNSSDSLLARSQPYFFEISQFLYQLGLSITRSSLDFFKIPKISYIVAALGLTCFLIGLQVATGHFLPLTVLYFLYLLVGVFGGFCYCNLMYKIYEKQSLTKQYKVQTLFLY